MLIHEDLSVAVLDQAIAKSILAAVRTRSNGIPKAKSRIWATTCGAGEALHAALERCAHGFEPYKYRGVPLPRQGQWAGYQAVAGGISSIQKNQIVSSSGTKVSFYIVEKAQHPNGPNAMFVDYILDEERLSKYELDDVNLDTHWIVDKSAPRNSLGMEVSKKVFEAKRTTTMTARPDGADGSLRNFVDLRHCVGASGASAAAGASPGVGGRVVPVDPPKVEGSRGAPAEGSRGAPSSGSSKATVRIMHWGCQGEIMRS